jgi:hypothetical protein
MPESRPGEGVVLRVTLRGTEVPAAVLGSGETLLFGRAPQVALPKNDPDKALRCTALTLPHCAPHVSRLVGELTVSEEVARLRWRSATAAQLASLFEAPGGARRVTLSDGMAALLDEGENHVTILRGRWVGGAYRDLLLVVEVAAVAPASAPAAPNHVGVDHDAVDTAPAPGLTPYGREWFVALALAEPWLSGADDYPRPPSNREIYERVASWHGYAWNLDRPQRVDDAIKSIAGIAFGPKDDPFSAASVGRAQNVRYAVGRRAAEVRLVTAEDLEAVHRKAHERTG